MARLTVSVGLAVLVASLPLVAHAGVGKQGTNLQGTNLQGTNLQGTNLQGTNLQGTNLQGTNLQSVGLSGTTLYGWWWDAAHGYWTYRYPDYYYTYLGGIFYGPYYNGGLAGSRMTGTLSNGMTIQLFMASVVRDTSANTMANPSYRSNSDVYLYEMWALVDSSWVYLCPGDHKGTFTSGTWDSSTGPGSAWDWGEAWSPSGTTFACTSGVISKCMRSWGYKPWKTLTDAGGRSHPMRPFMDRCIMAARADYCGLGESFTQNGTLVDLFDNFGFNTKLSEDAPNGMFATESVWNTERAWALELTRYESISSSLSCTPSLSGSEDWSYDNLSCPNIPGEECYTEYPTSLELWYGMWWAPSNQQFAYDNNTRQVQVSSSTYCSHNTCSVGPRMHSTCNTCTRNICAADPYCCSTYWDSICTSEVQSGTYCGTQTCSNTAP